MWTLFLARDDAYLDLAEIAFFQELVQLHFAKAEPVVCVEFARSFEAVAQKIENHQPTPALQDPARRRDGSLRMNGVMQRLA